MKLWIDDVRPAPEGYDWCKNINEAKNQILECEAMIRCSRRKRFWEIEVIDLDFEIEGRAAFLAWLEETKRKYQIRAHLRRFL